LGNKSSVGGKVIETHTETAPWDTSEVAAMPFPEGGIVADVIGVGGDEGVRRAHYTSQGVIEELIPLRWVTIKGHRCHDPEFIRETTASGTALAGPQGIYTGGLPGASIFFADKQGELVGPVLDYLELQHHGNEMMKWIEERCGSLLELYLATEGAIVRNAFFQPWCVAKFLVDEGMVEPEQVHTVATLADLWTAAAQGVKSYQVDWVSAKSQGLHDTGDTAEIFAKLGLSWMYEATLNVGFFGELELLWAPNGCRVMPVSHDSYFARVMAFLVTEMMGLSRIEWGVWTGGWSGVMRRILRDEEVDPSEATFEANLAFEGNDDQMFAITNACLLGGFYKELVQRGVRCSFIPAESSYEAAASETHKFLKRAKLLELDGVSPAVKPGDLVAQRGFGLALADTVYTHAKLCADQAKAGAELLGDRVPCTVAVSGGWGLNSASDQAFRDQGLELATTRHVASTTHDGAATLAYCLWSRYQGFPATRVWAARKIYTLRDL